MKIPKTIKQCSYAIQMQYVSLAPKALALVRYFLSQKFRPKLP